MADRLAGDLKRHFQRSAYRADDDQEVGIVPVPMHFGLRVAGSILIESAGVLGSAIAAATRVLGRRRFRTRRRRRQTVEVRPSRRARALLRRRKSMRVNVRVTFREGGQVTSAMTPLTLKAPRRR